MGEKEFYRRHLPHYQPADATFFITFRLAGSLPGEVIEELRAEREQLWKFNGETRNQRDPKKRFFWKEYFRKFDSILNGYSSGPMWLQKPAIAEIVKEAIHYRDGKVYDLLTYRIMSNHMHLVFDTEGFAPVRRADCPTYTVTEILRKLKWNTAVKANALLGRSGPFWQSESYDHVVRDEDELERIIWYVLENPVKAGLVNDWKDWRWSYVKEGLVEWRITSPRQSPGQHRRKNQTKANT